MALSGEVTRYVASQLGRPTAAVGIDALEASWQEIVGSPLPADMRDTVVSWQTGSE